VHHLTLRCFHGFVEQHSSARRRQTHYWHALGTLAAPPVRVVLRMKVNRRQPALIMHDKERIHAKWRSTPQNKCPNLTLASGTSRRGTSGIELMYAITSTSSSSALEEMAEMATASLNHCPACCNRIVLLLSFVKIALSFLNLVSTRHNRCSKQLS